jgi:hypothetical protein
VCARLDGLRRQGRRRLRDEHFAGSHVRRLQYSVYRGDSRVRRIWERIHVRRIPSVT